MNTLKLAAPILVTLACASSPALAEPILGLEAAGFAVLGGSTVTSTGATNIEGNLGVSAGTAITGFFGTIENDGPGVFSGTAHQGDPVAALAQTQLGLAMTSLGLMAPGSTLPADLSGLSLAPGVYSVVAGTSNLTGTLTLDGMGNANASWVFQMPSTLITSAGSSISIINTGANAGVFWNVGSSATLGAATSFAGNVFARASIALGTGARLGCGGAYAQTGAVTLIASFVSTGCAGGLSVDEPGEVAAAIAFAPFMPIPEPGIWAMMTFGLGLLAWVGRRRRDAR